MQGVQLQEVHLQRVQLQRVQLQGVQLQGLQLQKFQAPLKLFNEIHFIDHFSLFRLHYIVDMIYLRKGS